MATIHRRLLLKFTQMLVLSLKTTEDSPQWVEFSLPAIALNYPMPTSTCHQPGHWYLSFPRHMAPVDILALGSCCSLCLQCSPKHPAEAVHLLLRSQLQPHILRILTPSSPAVGHLLSDHNEECSRSAVSSRSYSRRAHHDSFSLYCCPLRWLVGSGDPIPVCGIPEYEAIFFSGPETPICLKMENLN